MMDNDVLRSAFRLTPTALYTAHSDPPQDDDSPESRKNLGASLQAQHRALGITMHELAQRTGISVNTIRSIFRGARVNKALARQLRQTLFSGSESGGGDGPLLLPEEIQIALAYRNADVKVKQFVTRLLHEPRSLAQVQALADLLRQLNSRDRECVATLIEHFHQRQPVKVRRPRQ